MPYPRGNVGHGDGCPHYQRNARRHGLGHGDFTAPQPLLPFYCGDAPLHLQNARFMAPHL